MERNMVIKFMAEDGLFNHLRISIGTQEQNRMLMKMIKDYLAEHKLQSVKHVEKSL
jgi:histidinol-phosphate/aromatic aminotransferase/cobyric acid decarboxylase-like protein